MCLVLASAESFTLYVLSKMAERYNGKTYGTLVRKALGRKLSAGGFLHLCNHDVWCGTKSMILTLCPIACSAVPGDAAVSVGLLHCVPGHHRRLVQSAAEDGSR